MSCASRKASSQNILKTDPPSVRSTLGAQASRAPFQCQEILNDFSSLSMRSMIIGYCYTARVTVLSTRCFSFDDEESSLRRGAPSL